MLLGVLLRSHGYNRSQLSSRFVVQNTTKKKTVGICSSLFAVIFYGMWLCGGLIESDTGEGVAVHR